jgi:hypothetical protein
MLREVHLDIAFSSSFRFHLQSLIILVKLDRHNSGVRQFKFHIDSLDIISELMTMLVLELDRDVHGRPKRETQCLIRVLRCKIVNLCNQYVQHHDLVAESLVLLNNDSDLTVLVKRADSFIIYQRDNWRLHLFVLIRVR